MFRSSGIKVKYKAPQVTAELSNETGGFFMKLFDTSGKWYKGNVHMHTTVSDGAMTPEDAVALYRRNGYDFVAITDHRIVSPGASFDDFLVLSGAEWDVGTVTGSPVYHILSIGMDADGAEELEARRIYRNGTPSVQSIINAIHSAGGLAVLAHPNWSVMIPEEMMELHGFDGAEIYNSVSTLPFFPDRADSSVYFDIWAKMGKTVAAYATDDTHHYEDEACRACVMVNAAELTRRDIVDSLRRGNFYATTGPLFRQIRIERERVIIECSEDTRWVLFETNTPWGRGNTQRISDGEAVYTLAPTDTFVRVTLIDGEGRKAYSSPVRLGG